MGRAYDKLGKPTEAVQSYESAAKIKPKDDQALLGLRSLFETQGSKNVNEYVSVGIRLAEVYKEADDKHKCQTAVDKLVGFAKTHGTKAQYAMALKAELPGSSIYDYLEGRLPNPQYTYKTLVEMVEVADTERINKEIGERRTRIGARIGQVTSEVKYEVYSKSELEDLYQHLIDWTNDDEARRQYEEKLLQRAYDALVAFPQEKKAAKREQVVKLARGMVIIKHPFLLAWQIELEWKDIENAAEFDVGILREYVDFFPEDGLSKVLKGFLASDISPFPQPKAPEQVDTTTDNGEETLEQSEPLSPEDVLILLADGIDDAKQSTLAHRLVGEYYLHLEEFESAVDTVRKGLKLHRSEAKKSGLVLQCNLDALNSTLATSLIQYQSPKNHPEAKALFDELLQRKSSFSPALIGVGLIYEEEEDYPKAIEFLTKAYKRDPSNARIGAEAAWCRALNSNYSQALEELEEFLAQMDPKDPKSRESRAQTTYRIGVCLWELDPSRAARKDRKGAYAMFLSALKINPNFAPAYTSLGLYYADYAKDKKRARSCFQKAFELSSSEILAAERLAESFADLGDWDIVEVIAQRVVDSGKVKPSPGSKKKGVSWPFSSLGVVHMNKQDYTKAIPSFLAALRISPDDYHSYVGLGESYHNSGRYNSAARTFQYAEEPPEGVKMKTPEERWFTKYMLANVNRELGNYDEAIAGYEDVLSARNQEFGVEIALLQTLLERAWRKVETGFFGEAIDSTLIAVDVAAGISEYRPDAFNLWKAVGDACSIFSWVQSRLGDFPAAKLKTILEASVEVDEYKLFSEADGIGPEALAFLKEESKVSIRVVIYASVLAHKRAIYTSANDIHAQAVAWYNLGWAEYRAHVCLERNSVESDAKKVTKSLKAAMKCFKRAIELEAGNYEFWNALGVVTTQLNPKVAQHCFVRSLHLNERNVKVWTNLGTLYLIHNDLELAHQAFSRAQSTDPDYAHAWIGEGLIALLWGDTTEALSHFVHAFGISDSASTIVKRQYAVSTFDHLLNSGAREIADIIQPILALEQLSSQLDKDYALAHLSGLFLERAGNFLGAVDALSKLCADLEAAYETTESPQTLSQFAAVKADFARTLLATHAYSEAAETAETALDLLSDPDSNTLSSDALRKTQLSARLTLGLTHHYLSKTNSTSSQETISAFRLALQDSSSSPDVVCLLATVLWAHGGEEEKNVAREQLFEVIEQHPHHIDAVIILGAMAAVEEDVEAMEAVHEDIASLRTSTSKQVNTLQLRRIERVLDAIAAISSSSSSSPQQQGEFDKVLATIQTSILINPSQPHGWSQLAEQAGDEDGFPAQMALVAAKRAVPPRGPLDAEDLARAFMGTGVVADGQRAAMVAPWVK